VKSFDEIFVDYDTDKVSHHTYGSVYDELFPEDARRKVKTILEIGIYRGGSMYGWRDFFPEADIVGLDVNPDYMISDSFIHTFVADCNDPTAIVPIARNYGPFDLIVDDGPHDPRSQITALLNLWSHVLPGGYYVIEDVLADKYHNIMNYYSYFPGTVHDFRHISNIRNDVMLVLQKGI
jgi:hypothetical protein